MAWGKFCCKGAVLNGLLVVKVGLLGLKLLEVGLKEAFVLLEPIRNCS